MCLLGRTSSYILQLNEISEISTNYTRYNIYSHSAFLGIIQMEFKFHNVYLFVSNPTAVNIVPCQGQCVIKHIIQHLLGRTNTQYISLSTQRTV